MDGLNKNYRKEFTNNLSYCIEEKSPEHISNRKFNSIEIPNYTDTWSSVDEMQNGSDTYYLMENDEWGDEAQYLIIDERKNVISDGVYNGFEESEFVEYLENIAVDEKPIELAQEKGLISQKPDAYIDTSRKTVYVCSPLAGEIAENIRKAREYSKYVAQQGATPIAPHITELFNDAIPEEREMGLSMGLDYLRHADELWVFGDRISSGMKAEIKMAREELHIPIYSVDENTFEKVEFTAPRESNAISKTLSDRLSSGKQQADSINEAEKQKKIITKPYERH